MTTVEVFGTLALVAVAVMLLARARWPGRTDRERKDARAAVTLMFVAWFSAILYGKFVLWAS